MRGRMPLLENASFASVQEVARCAKLSWRLTGDVYGRC